MRFLLLLLFFSCSSLKKDNEPHNPIENPTESVDARYEVYNSADRSLFFDENNAYAAHGTIGDSALFTCLAYAADMIEIDPVFFFTPEGKPVRHRDINETISDAPISKDMVNGILWCLYKLGKKEKDKALALISKMIDYGRKNAILGVWNFCSKEDVEKYGIDLKTSVGKCLMTPAVMKDTHRVAIWLGRDCDALCKVAMAAGPNTASNPKNFSKHLAAITTARNGLVEGGINDNSLNQLKAMAEGEPRNTIFSAIYGRFNNGEQNRTWILLSDPTLFPEDELPTHKNYCSDYLMQRQERRYEDLKSYDKDGKKCVKYHDPETKEIVEDCNVSPDSKGEVKTYVYNSDWLSCDKHEGPRSVIDWIFSYKMAKGEI